jgi:deferrochelatase/peroxidase EfeB
VQACAEDPQVAFHAVRTLARIGRGVVVMRWSQLGFGRTTSTSREEETGRNLFGFKDGTNNLKAEDRASLERHVWAGPRDEPAWMRGGTYMVARRVRMLIEVWDRSSLGDQEATFGRHKASGAPIGRRGEFDAVDLEARGEDGALLVPRDAHVRLAAQGGEAILRRSFSFTDGTDDRGQLDAGLFSSASSATRESSSCPCSAASGPTTPSTSTSPTQAAPSSPSRPAPARAATSANGCSKVPRRRRARAGAIV